MDDLGGRLKGLLGPRHPVAAVAVVSSRRHDVVVLGAPVDAAFEIGSISKGVTGLLYADALARGEVRPETTLSELLPLDDAPAGRVTLAALSTHTSGLPRLPSSAQPYRRTLALWRHGANPYGDDLAELLRQAATAKVGRPKPRYSNFGFELLGHALAAATGTTYAHLVRQRIAAPLGLTGVTVPATDDDLPPGALTGRSRRGRPRQPWTGEAVGPAGGIRAPIGDLATLMAALLNGSAPGVAALDPVARFGAGTRIGAAWVTIGSRGREVTWHNGATGGFRSWLGLDRGAGAGVAVVSATAESVDRPGFTLLKEEADALRPGEI